MKVYAILNVFLILAEGSSWDRTSARFVKNYYDDRNVQQIVVFGCSDIYDYLRFARDSMELDTRINFAKIIDSVDMTRILKVNYYTIGVVLDYVCPRGEFVLDQFIEHRLVFNESYHWLVLSSYDVKIPMELLGRLPLSVETEFTIAERHSNSSYVLHDVYNPSYRHNGRLNVTFKGSWTLKDGLKDELTQYKYNRRGNFHGLALNFSISLMNPALPDWETYLTTPVNRHLDTMTRYHYALILQLRDVYNFTINLKRATSWGYLVNGTWTGILADMVNGTVDISVTPLRYIPERMDVCEYTVETYLVRLSFIFRHPKKSTLRNPFLKPFVPEVWYFVAAVGAIFYLILLLTRIVEKKFVDDQARDLRSSTGIDVVAAISQQGTFDLPKIISGRIGFIFLFLWGVLLFQFYSASIVGSLLAEPPRFITTPTHLKDSNIDVWFEKVVYYYDYFRSSKDPVELAFWEKKIKPTKERPNGSFTDAINGMNLVKKGGYAFHVDRDTSYKIVQETFTEEEICDLQEIQMIGTKKVAIATAKRSPFKKMIIYGLRRMVQHGITDALRKVWVTPRPSCPDAHNSMPVPIQAKEFSPAIFLLLMGLFAAIFIMALEYCHQKVLVSFYPEKLSSGSTKLDRMESSTDVATEEDPDELMNCDEVS